MTFCTKELSAVGVPTEALEARALRRRLKVTQGEFAALAGVSRTSVIRYEIRSEGRPVKPATAEKIRRLVDLWKLKTPVLTRKPERRGGWKRQPQNDNADAILAPVQASGLG